MKKVYICHPFSTHGNPVTNMQLVTEICKVIAEINVIPVSPLHAFSFFTIKDNENYSIYRKIIDYCIELLRCCDQIWVFDKWWKSKGCVKEVKYAIKHKIPVFEVYIEGGDIIELKELSCKTCRQRFTST